MPLAPPFMRSKLSRRPDVAELPTTLTLFGGHFIVPPRKGVALEGEAPKSFGVTAFDSAERAKAWYDSPAYQAHHPAAGELSEEHGLVSPGRRLTCCGRAIVGPTIAHKTQFCY